MSKSILNNTIEKTTSKKSILSTDENVNIGGKETVDSAIEKIKPTISQKIGNVLKTFVNPSLTLGSNLSSILSKKKEEPISIEQKVETIKPIEPVIEQPKTIAPKSLKDKYIDFSKRGGQLAGELDVGIMKTFGETLGALHTIGTEIATKPLAKVLDRAFGTTIEESQKDKNAGELINKFAENFDKHLGVEEKKFVDKVFEGAGSSIPFLVGGVAGKMLGTGEKVLSLGLSGMEALVNAYDDYKTLVSEDDKNSKLKAVASFGANMAVNYITNKLGFLSNNVNKSTFGTIKKFITDGLVETGQETAQQFISNIVTSKDPMYGLGETFLVSAPISFMFGFGGIIQNPEEFKDNKQLKNTIKEIADSGITKDKLSTVISSLNGIDKNEVSKTLDEITVDDKDINKTFADNQKSEIVEISKSIKPQKTPKIEKEKITKIASQFKPAPVKEVSLEEEAKKYPTKEEFVKAHSDFKTGFDIGKYGASKLNIGERGSWSAKDIMSGKSPLQNISIDKLKLSNQEPDIYQSFIKTGAKGNIKDGYTVYRVVPKGSKINAGDFVFSNEKSAKEFLNEYGIKRGQTEIQKLDNIKLDELLLPITEKRFYETHTSSMEFPTDELIYAPKELQNIGIKTKSQLEEIWEKANTSTQVSPETSLLQEAKKYATAEEFVKAQPNIAEYSPLDSKNVERSIKNLNEVGIPVKSGEDIITLYHGTNAKGMKGITESGTLNPFSYLATDKNASQGFAFGNKGGVLEIKVPVKDAGFVQTPMAGAKGATIQNPVKLIKGEDGIWRAEQWKTKSQLEEIYNKAHKGEEKLSRPFLGNRMPVSTEEARKVILESIGKEGFTEKDLRILFTEEEMAGKADGSFEKKNRIYGDLVKLYEKGGKANLITALHESKHFLFSKMPESLRTEMLEKAKEDIGPLYKTVLERSYGKEGVYEGENRENALLEEYIVEKWAKTDAKDYGYKPSWMQMVFKFLDDKLKKIVDAFKKIRNFGISLEEPIKLVEETAEIKQLNRYKDSLKARRADPVLVDAIVTPDITLIDTKTDTFEEITKQIIRNEEVFNNIWQNFDKIRVFDNFYKKGLISEAKKMYGEDLTEAEIQKELASDFETYVNERETGKQSTFFDKIKEFFDRLYAAFKRIFKTAKDIKEYIDSLPNKEGGFIKIPSKEAKPNELSIIKEKILNKKPFTINEQNSWNNNTHFPIDYNEEYNSILSKVISKAEEKFGEEIPEEINYLIEEYAGETESFLREKGKQMLNAPSPFVTGRAGYNFGKADKARSVFEKKVLEFNKYTEDVEKDISSMANKISKEKFSQLSEAEKIESEINKNIKLRDGLNPTRDDWYIEQLNKKIKSLNRKLDKINSQSQIELKTDELSLIEEAKKYKSVEEFKQAQELKAEEIQKELNKKAIEIGEANNSDNTELAIKIGNEMGVLRSQRNELRDVSMLEEIWNIAQEEKTSLETKTPDTSMIVSKKVDKLEKLRKDLEETERKLDVVNADLELYGKDLRDKLKAESDDLREQIKKEKFPTFDTGNRIEDLKRTLAFAEESVGMKPRTKKDIVLPKELEEKQTSVEILKETLELDPAKELEAYAPKTGRFKDELPEVLGKSKEELKDSEEYKNITSPKTLEFIKKGDTIVDAINMNYGTDWTTEDAREAFAKYISSKKRLKEREIEIKKEVSEYTKEESDRINAENLIIKENQALAKKYNFTIPEYKDEQVLTIPDLIAFEETVNRHPGKAFWKYANKRTGILPKIIEETPGLYGKTMKSLLEKKGLENLEEAQLMLDSYIAYANVLDQMYTDTFEPVEMAKSEEEFLTPIFEAEKARLAKKEGKPLETIIEQSDKYPLKKKVGILDYVRTPNRVLKKIGLEDEAKVLKRKYEDYIKELPENIEKINSWYKRVPDKDSARKIFDYLDQNNEALTEDGFLKPDFLTAEETKVAEEIKSWLSKWADRLHLDPKQRIANYITHIFSDDLIKKEFDEDLAKIIRDKVPGEVYDPFLEERLGAMGYKRDVFLALDAYVKRATRKVHMDQALEQLKFASSKLDDQSFQYIKKYIDRVNLRPTETDKLIDTTIKQIVGYRLGNRPVANITRKTRQMIYRGTLGLNVGSALRNITQGANTFAKLGSKYTTIGYYKLLSPESHAELNRENVLGMDIIQDRALSATKKFWEKFDKGLFIFFQTAERINRGSAYFGARAKYYDENTRVDKNTGTRIFNEGASERDAIEYAKKMVEDTQFVFGSIDTPQVLQSDIAKTLLQFQSFNIKQAEFLAEMAKNKEYAGLVRWALASLAFLVGIGDLFGMEWKDLIPFTRYRLPPLISGPSKLFNAVVGSKDQYGNVPSLKKRLNNALSAIVPFIPGGVQAKKSIEAVKAVKEGKSVDIKGKTQYEVEPGALNATRAIIFGKNTLPEAQSYFDKEETPEEKTVRKIYENVQDMTDEEASKYLSEKFPDTPEGDRGYEIYKQIKATEKRKVTEALEPKMLEVVNEVYRLDQEGKEDEAQKLVDDLTDEEYNAYTLAKKHNPPDGSKPKYTDNEEVSANNIFDSVLLYAKAIKTDPITAFNRIFTGQRIKRIANDAIIVERMPLSKSAKVKEERGATSDMRLDHVVSLELGGSNAKRNLMLVPEEIWASYTPVENYLGKLLQSGNINKRQAQKAITGFKEGKITFDQIKQDYK